MSYSSRFWLYAPLTLFLALVVWVSVNWWLVAGAFDRKLHALEGHEAAPGVTLDWSKVTISGFPFRVDAVFDGLVVTGAGAHGPFAWKAEHFALHALTYGAEKDVLEAAGQQTLSWADAKGAGHGARFLPATLHASAVRDAKGVARFDVDIVGAAGDGFTADRLQFHMRRDPDGKTIDLMASADELNSKTAIGFFGPHVKRLSAYAALTPAAPFLPVLKGEAPLPAADAAFHHVGGSLHLAKLDVVSTNLTATVSNTELSEKFSALFSPLY